MRQARPSRPTARSPQRSARCPTSGEMMMPNSASDDISIPTCPAVMLRVVFMTGMMGGRNWSESAKATVRAYPATRYHSFLFIGLLFGNCESLGVRHHGIHNLRLSGFLQRHEADGISEFAHATTFADDLGQFLRVPGDTARQSVDVIVEHEHREGGRRADEDDPRVAGEFQQAWQGLVGERRAGDRDDVQMRKKVFFGLLGRSPSCGRCSKTVRLPEAERISSVHGKCPMRPTFLPAAFLSSRSRPLASSAPAKREVRLHAAQMAAMPIAASRGFQDTESSASSTSGLPRRWKDVLCPPVAIGRRDMDSPVACSVCTRYHICPAMTSWTGSLSHCAIRSRYRVSYSGGDVRRRMASSPGTAGLRDRPRRSCS